ncbi:glycosyltransferase family 2 protein [Oceanihabitans sediminis]|uniref:glycosyltransferase family 2 protein n=1 Tax=Oceanihabitans sediminis TaxID=1812012 RepID=UPI00299EBD29|nr:glycosyltransferase family 2 protein [Oceanihabitans sediminis]MDX1774833.1 glycosyltransferase family 2 protein [Oceanihabitans sediminis]
MQEQPLVSIIIPTFNRAHLIGETLDSVLAQTYQNWECIVVDDGSTDGTDVLMGEYVAKDCRFQYHHRPADRLPGGNAARNYGFEVSKGEYIQWFDSDDLMVPEKIEIKVKTILENNVDFVISQTQYFNREKGGAYAYNYKGEEVDFLSYAITYISWFTPDLFLNQRIAKKISFNEFIKAGQEYNFSCKLLLETNSLKKIDRVLSLRRHHFQSIGRKRQLDEKHYHQTVFELHWVNLNELKENYDIPQEFARYSLLKCLRSKLENNEIRIPVGFFKSFYKYYGFKAIYLYLAIASNWLLKRYHFFYNKLK